MRRSRTMPEEAAVLAAADDVEALILEGVAYSGIQVAAGTTAIFWLYGPSEEGMKLNMSIQEHLNPT